MSDAVGNQFTTLGRIQLALFIEEIVHIHTLQLGDTLFLRHLVVEFVDLLLYICCRVTSCHNC